jgi:hypothetical protein
LACAETDVFAVIAIALKMSVESSENLAILLNASY